MAEISRKGHRHRMRCAYLATGIDSMADHNVLELLLSLVIPQKDVKPLAYDLINHFGSLENVMAAEPQELMKINGIGESAAVAICLVRDINKRIYTNKNSSIKRINTTDIAAEFCKNMLCNEKVEKLLLITLRGDGTIINSSFIGSGIVSSVDVNTYKITKMVLQDRAAAVILAHNHPGGDARPSAADVNFTVEINSVLRKFDVQLTDHIIIADDDCYCMSQNLEFLMKTENLNDR